MRVMGLVKWFDVRRACGVIGGLDGAADCVLRQSGMQGTALRVVSAGDAVEFDVVPGVFGPMARNVVRLAARGPNPGPDIAVHASV
jgi:cold shock CspA family protein